MVFALIPCFVYPINQPTSDTICQPTDDKYTIVYSFQGVDFSLPLHGNPSWQYMIEYHNINSCQIRQHTLTVLPISQPTIQYDTICWGETYIWNGIEYNTTGSYTDTLTNIYGCDSIVTLYLTILPEVQYFSADTLLCHGVACHWRGQSFTSASIYNDTIRNTLGCDSLIYTLHLAYLPATQYIEAQHATICHGENYVWREKEYNTAGIYTDTVRNILHGDSLIYSLNLIVNYATTFDTIVVACDHYEWLNETYSASGVFVDTLTNTLGCDSIVTLHLTVNYTTTFDTTVVVCDSFNWLGKNLTTSGLYIDTLTNTTGCDSIVTLNLTVNYTTTYDTTVVACDNYEWLGKSLTTSGIYVDTLTNKTGCDSIVTLNLTVNYTTTYDTTVVACDNFDWLGKSLTTSGIYVDTLTNKTGCDSIVTLNLTVNTTTTYDTTVVACDSYEWLGKSLTTSGIYVDTLTNNAGCDSIVTLDLTINYGDTIELTHTACDSYTWHGNTHTTSGTYYQHFQNQYGCDSLEVLHLTVNYTYHTTQVDTMVGYNPYYWHGDTLLQAGEYTRTFTAATNCDSIITLHLIENPVAIELADIPEICAGDSIINIPINMDGYIDYLQLIYSFTAHQVGFRDTTYFVWADELQVLSHDVRAGVYDANLVAFFHQEEVLSQSLTFKILYPTTIFEQQWNDLISVLTAKYNGGYDFTAFQWYKDGEMLHNETNSYLHQSLSFGSEYSVLLTDPNGQQLMSCPIVPIDLANISIYPTIVNAGEYVKCSITEDATIMLYNSVGQVIGEYHALAGELCIEMPLASGMYMFKIITTNNNQHEIKVFVR